MKHAVKWTIAVLVVVLVAGGVLRAMSARKAQQAALATSQATNATQAQSVVELARTDVGAARTRLISQGLPVTGSLKAVDSAFVKARVAGELQGLSVREGDLVKAGQVLGRIESTEYPARLRQARDQAESARAQVDIARRQFENNKALVDQGFISKTALDTSQANLNAAQSTYSAALGAVDVARKSVDDSVLKSPIAGQVSQRLAQTGERVAVEAKIVEIIDVSRLELEAPLGAADSLDIRPGQAAQLYIEGSSRPVAARVARINPSAQAGSRSVLAYLSLDKAAGDGLSLRQGLFARGTIGTVQVSLLSVPVSAVRTDKPSPYVQLVEDGRVVHKGVETGARGDFEGLPVVAVTGIAENAVVISGAVGSLREGTAVRFTASMSPTGTPARPAQPARPSTP
ncbi:MAG: efflux RND transporter periplasmic adaptor subunit [Comamonadaceae bacterium]|nr:MAG: efflux RND transporter periplasmic adaptor subunit [Comamonadaceae bacterium]